MSERRECAVCWWIYDPEAGDEDGQIPPGVAFEDLPEAYACPRCGAAKERFVRQTSDQEHVSALVAAYRAADARMRGLPIHNPRLEVEAVGFARRDGLLVGALVTPWFLNIVVIGREVPPSGDTVDMTFAGGKFPLVATHEGVPHLALLLVSPMNLIADQTAARAVAKECLRLVLGGDEAAKPKVVGRRGLFGGILGG